MDQKEYMQGLDEVSMSPQRACQKKEPLTTSEQTRLRELVGRINWAVQGSRPDMAFEMVDLSTKFHGGTVEDLVRAMKAIRRLKMEDASVVFPNLGGRGVFPLKLLKIAWTHSKALYLRLKWFPRPYLQIAAASFLLSSKAFV